MEMCLFVLCVILVPHSYIGRSQNDATEGKLIGYGLFPLLSYCIGMYFDLGAGFTDGSVVVRSIAQQEKQIQALFTDSRQHILTFSKPFSIFHTSLLTNVLALLMEDRMQFLKLFIYGSYAAVLSIYWPISSKISAGTLQVGQIKRALLSMNINVDWIDSMEFISLMSVIIIGFLVFELTFSICRRFSPSSFTFGESVIMSNITSVCFLRLVDLSRSAHLLVADDVSMVEALIELMILSTVFFGISCYFIFVKLTKRRYNTTLNYMAYAVAYYSIVLVYIVPTVLLPKEAESIDSIKNPIIWIIEFIFIKDVIHLEILAYWLICISFMFIIMSFSKEQTVEVSKTKKKDLIYLFGGRMSVPKIIYRKFFHIMAVIMFVPVTIQRPLFMCLSYAVAICLFLLIESFRVQFITEHEVNSLAKALHFYIKQFTDSRDSGTFILTHIYLLIGCMIPTCVEIFSHEKTINYHRILSGVMILGIGDTMASVIGFNFGKTKWNYPANTKKSVEGTIASFLSVCFISYLVVPIHFTSNMELLSYIFCTLAASMLEAYTVQIDNLILPVFFYTLLCAFSTIQTHLFKKLILSGVKTIF